MDTHKLCKLCGKKGKVFCDKCKKVVYCSKDCKFKDWNKHKSNCASKEFHKKEINSNFKRKTMNYINKKENNIRNSISFLEEKNLKRRKSIKIKRNDKIKEIEYEKLESFNFKIKLYDILFKRSDENNSTSNIFANNDLSDKNIIRNEKIEKIKKLHILLLEHRNFLKTKILLNSEKEKNFKYLKFMIDTYSRIESYIFHFLILIKFLYSLKDPVSLIKADGILKILGHELFIISGANQQGLLIYSIDMIIKRFLEELESINIPQKLNSIFKVLKRFLSLISSILKISFFLEDSTMYKKTLSYYDKIYNIALRFISSNKDTEKAILKSNLHFNIANIFIKNKYINSALKLYKNVLQVQKIIEPRTFLFGVVYYNISLIYFVMDRMKDMELFLNEGFEKINKLLNNKKIIHQIEDFRKLIKLYLIFYAEINLDRFNFGKALESMQLLIENMIDDNQNLRKNRLASVRQKNKINIDALKQLKSMLKNYIKRASVYYAKNDSRYTREEIVFKKDKILSAFESLYQINFYSSKADKAIFDEKIKNYINEFLNKIQSFYSDKEKIVKDKKKKTMKLDIKSSKLLKFEIFENNFTKNREQNTINKEIDNNLPELNLTNIIKINNNYTEDNLFMNNLNRGRNNTITKSIAKSFLKEREKEDVNIEEINKNINKSENNDKIYLNEEITKKIVSYLNDKIIKKKKVLDDEKSISDFEYFFLLLTTLSYHQIEILNDSQPANSTEMKYRNLPIFFSKQFKNSLNPNQKRMFNKLRVLSLIRGNILKDPNLPISVDNINFSIFKINLKFDDFKIKNKNVPNIIRDMKRLEQKNNNKIDYDKHIQKSPVKRESLFSMFDGKDNEKERIQNYIKHKIKKAKKLSDSEEDNEASSVNMDSEVDFKYQNQFDINKLKTKLIKKINNKKSLSEKGKKLYIEIINSNIFIQLLNSLDMTLIKEFVQNLETLLSFLKLVKKKSMKEFKLYKQLKNNKNEENSSDYSIPIEYEKNFINIIKKSFGRINIIRNKSMDRYNLNKKIIFLKLSLSDEHIENKDIHDSSIYLRKLIKSKSDKQIF